MADDLAGNESSADEPEAGQRSTGRVKWFNNTKGFGFIVADGSDDGSDLFAHYSAIEMNGYRTLKAGQHVSFTTADGPKGLHAMDIQSADANDNTLESTEDKTKSHIDEGEHHGIDVELPASDPSDGDDHSGSVLGSAVPGSTLPGSSAAQR